MQFGRIAGPYAPSYPEVIRKLIEEVDYLGFQIYVVLVTLFNVEEDWDQDSEWVCGIVRATKTDILNKTESSRRGFYNAWKKLADCGLVVQESRGSPILIPYFKKKSDDFISYRQIRRNFSAVFKLLDVLSDRMTDEEKEQFSHVLASNGMSTECPNLYTEYTNLYTEYTSLTRAGTLKDLNKINNIKEEENQVLPLSQNGDPDHVDTHEDHEGESELANRKFIVSRADNLWPGRGYKPDVDDLSIAEIERFPLPAVQEAFDAAQKAEIVYGSWEWIINRLRQPGFYKGNDKPKGKRGTKKDVDPENGRLLGADWFEKE